MIASLYGRVLEKGRNFLIIDIAGVGYKVNVSNQLLSEVAKGEDILLFTYHQVGEQIQALYGLRSMADLEFFELLLSVSGVGPKTALAVFCVASLSDIQESIMRNDHSLLSQVSGIGKKTAERIVLELKNKIGSLAVTSSGLPTALSDELEALGALGYGQMEAREALASLPAGDSSQERIKAALRLLGRRI